MFYLAFIIKFVIVLSKLGRSNRMNRYWILLIWLVFSFSDVFSSEQDITRCDANSILPPPVWTEVFYNLDGNTLCRLMRVCKAWHACAQLPLAQQVAAKKFVKMLLGMLYTIDPLPPGPNLDLIHELQKLNYPLATNMLWLQDFKTWRQHKEETPDTTSPHLLTASSGTELMEKILNDNRAKPFLKAWAFDELYKNPTFFPKGHPYHFTSPADVVEGVLQKASGSAQPEVTEWLFQKRLELLQSSTAASSNPPSIPEELRLFLRAEMNQPVQAANSAVQAAQEYYQMIKNDRDGLLAFLSDLGLHPNPALRQYAYEKLLRMHVGKVVFLELLRSEPDPKVLSWVYDELLMALHQDTKACRLILEQLDKSPIEELRILAIQRRCEYRSTVGENPRFINGISFEESGLDELNQYLKPYLKDPNNTIRLTALYQFHRISSSSLDGMKNLLAPKEGLFYKIFFGDTPLPERLVLFDMATSLLWPFHLPESIPIYTQILIPEALKDEQIAIRRWGFAAQVYCRLLSQPNDESKWKMIRDKILPLLKIAHAAQKRSQYP